MTLDLNTSPPLDAALYYAAHGLAVFPLHTIDPGGVCSCAKADCSNPGKHPLTPHGLLDASTDPAVIRRWWARNPTANVAIRTGGDSHLVVIDIDPRHGGLDSWKALTAEQEFCDTKEVQTGGGGNHLFFRSDRPVHNSQGDVGGIAAGVDVRGEGGYVVAPPSNHVSGGRYLWCDLEIATAPLPDWLYELATRPSTRVNGHGNKHLDVAEIMEGVAEGGRDWALFQLASKCRYADLPQAIAEAVVLEAASKCSPPFPPDEARAKVASAYGRYAASRTDSNGDVVEQIEWDKCRVTTVTPLGLVAITFADMERDRREIAAELTIAFVESEGREPYQTRINLLSMSARDQLRRELDGVFGKDAGWAKVIHSAFAKAARSFEHIDRVVPLETVEAPETLPQLVWGFMPASGPTILFGSSEGGKTWLVLSLAIAVSQGGYWLGRRCERRNVLYLDYETGETALAQRARRLGMTMAGIHYLSAEGVPLADQIPTLLQAIARHNCGLLIVDHVIAACGGRPEEAEVAMKCQRALARLHIPTLLIAHVTGEGERDPSLVLRPFGSVLWKAMARSMWFIQKTGSGVSLDVGLFCRKSSNSSRPDDFAVTIDFDDPGGPITITPVDIVRRPQLNASRDSSWRVWEAMPDGLEVTPRQIADVAGMSESTVKRILAAGHAIFECVSDGGSGRGNSARWLKKDPA